MLRIDPKFSFRVDLAQIRAFYRDLEAAFDAGDFSLVAAYSEDPELAGCAMVLTGLPEFGLQRLETLASLSPRARVCRGLALWMVGRTDEASSLLDQAMEGPWGEFAAAVRAAVTSDRINIFVPSLITAMPMTEAPAQFAVGQFLVSKVGTQAAANAFGYEPDDSLRDLVERLEAPDRPDFCVTFGSQALIPRDYDLVDVPKVAWHNDDDIFYYRAAENLYAHDISIFNTSHEHFEHCLLGPSAAITQLMIDPFGVPFPEKGTPAEKRFDLMFSGRAAGDFETDRARFLFNLADRCGSTQRLAFIDGHMPADEYRQVLSSSRYLPVVCRYAGMPSPRWREALAAGTALLSPEGTLYDAVMPGAFPYRADAFVSDIADILSSDPSSAQTESGAAADRLAGCARFLAFHQQAQEIRFERTLKLCCAAGLYWKHVVKPGQPAPGHLAVERSRPTYPPRWLMPSNDVTGNAAEAVFSRYIRATRNFIGRGLPTEQDYSIALHNLFYIASYLGFLFKNSDNISLGDARMTVGSVRKVAADYIQKIRTRGVIRYPQSLVLRFTSSLIGLYLNGFSNQESLDELRWIDKNFEDLSFDPHSSDIGVIGVHFTDPVISYFDYAEIVLVEALVATGRVPHPDRPKVASRAALHALVLGFIGNAQLIKGLPSDAIEPLERSVALNPLNWKTLYLLFQAYRRHLTDGTGTEPGEAGLARFIEVFVSMGEAYPMLFLKHLHDVLPTLDRLGRRDDMQTLLDQWWRTSRCFYEGSLATPYMASGEALDICTRYAGRLHGDLRRKFTEWGERPPLETLSPDMPAFDRHLFASWIRTYIFPAARSGTA